MPTASAIKEKAKRLTFGAVVGALLSSGVLAVVMGAGSYVNKVDGCVLSIAAVESLAARHEVAIASSDARAADVVARLDRIEGKLDAVFYGGASPRAAVVSGTNTTNSATNTP